jgi:hypothetical protein
MYGENGIETLDRVRNHEHTCVIAAQHANIQTRQGLTAAKVAEPPWCR